MSDQSSGTGGAESANAVLRDSLEKGKPRFFRASSGAARGKSGREDTEKFAENLMTLQECAQLIGVKMEMHAVSYGMVYDGNETIAFRFDPNSNPHNPELVGALVNRRMPMRELLAGMSEFLNE